MPGHGVVIDQAMLHENEIAAELNARLRTLEGWAEPDLRFVGVLQLARGETLEEQRGWLVGWGQDEGARGRNDESESVEREN